MQPPRVEFWVPNRTFNGWVDDMLSEFPDATRMPMNMTVGWGKSIREAGQLCAKHFDERWADVPDVVVFTNGERFTDAYYRSVEYWRTVPLVFYAHGTDFSYGEPMRDWSIVLEDLLKMHLAQAVVWPAEGQMEWTLTKYYDQFYHTDDLSIWLHDIREKSYVVPPGQDLTYLSAQPQRKDGDGVPTILWNHRMQTDKQPSKFFHALEVLAERGHDFKVAICSRPTGTRVAQRYNEFRERLADRIIHEGHVNDRDSYARIVEGSDIVVNCSESEGASRSVLEAVYAGAIPVLPSSGAFPEMFSAREALFYVHSDDDRGLIHALEEAINGPEPALERPNEKLFFNYSLIGAAEQLHYICVNVYEAVVERSEMPRSKKIEQLAEFVERSGSGGVTDKQLLDHLGWGTPDWWAQYAFALKYRGFRKTEGKWYARDLVD